MISIVTSLYKSERHLGKFLRRAQKVSRELIAANIPHEFIILPNDPSPAETELLTKAAANFTNNALRVITRTREPLYATWNEGVNQATYPHVTFWNVDDVRFSKGIIDGVSVLTNTDTEVVYFPIIYKRYVNILGINILAKRKILRSSEFDAQKFKKEMHIGPFFMFKKSIVEKVGLFNPTFTVAGDFEWQVRGAIAGIKFKSCPTIGGIFTNDGKTLSGAQSTKHLDENKRVLELGSQ